MKKVNKKSLNLEIAREEFINRKIERDCIFVFDIIFC